MISLVIASITIVFLILSIIFFPTLTIRITKVHHIKVSTYWVIALVGALLLLLSKQIPLSVLLTGFKDPVIGPLPILVLFISMTVLSISLDEVGFFKYVASVACSKAKGSSFKLFLYLYLITSILTVFTSNDIIILTFTPFICYFCYHTKLNPLPFLVSEFVAANTWSMALLIGNPTNIYIGTCASIDFFEYVKHMILPTIVAGTVSFLMLYLLFHKEFNKKIESKELKKETLNKPLLIITLLHLGCCILLLSISSYIHLSMWQITLGFMISEIIIILIYNVVTHTPPVLLEKTLRRAPYVLIPFLLSMFTIVSTLSYNGITAWIAKGFTKSPSAIVYGITTFFSCNLINNIPTSVLMADVLKLSCPSLQNTLACICATNIGAIFTPIGALAGIMWMSILKDQNVKYNFIDFVKYGVIIAIPTLIASLLCISIF